MGSSQYIFKTSFKSSLFDRENILNSKTFRIDLPNKDFNTEAVQPEQLVNPTLNVFFKKLIDNDILIKKYITSKNTKKFMTTNTDNSQNTTYFDDVFHQDSGGQSISTWYTNDVIVKDHISRYHSGQNTMIYNINQKCADISCSNLNLELNEQYFTKDLSSTACGISSIENDEVIEFEFEDTYPNFQYVAANIYNQKTNYKAEININSIDLNGELPSISKLPYILKKWISGMNELYVYIPTTFTYYDENCELSNSTLLELKLNRIHFNISQIFSIQINGESLPLRIDTDRTNGVYTDQILPSIVKSIPLQSSYQNITEVKSDKKHYYLYFGIHGTDSQAIKIMYF